MRRRRLLNVALTTFIITTSTSDRSAGQAAVAQGTGEAPMFQVEDDWLKIPNNWVLGVVSTVDVDKDDNVWVLHRPRSGVADQNKDRVAPPVLQFDSTGKFLQAWGGPSSEYEWPDREHVLHVDDNDFVWIAGTARPPGGPGTGRSDDMVLKFTRGGKFVMQIGRRGQSRGAADTRNTYGAADLFVYPKTNELFVGDEGNLRVIVFDAGTGAFKRMWSAFGSAPVDRPRAAVGTTAPPARASSTPQERAPLETEGPGPAQFGESHAVRVSSDGLVYVADRPNRRIQVFTRDGKFVTQAFVNRSGPASVSAVGLTFSSDPDQRFMYVADFGNSHVVVMERKTLRVLYQFGRRGEQPGDFQGVHYLAVDAGGNLYVAEVEPGSRVQKFVFKGYGSPPATQ